MTSRVFLESGFLLVSDGGVVSGEARGVAVHAGSLAPLEKTRGFGMKSSGSGGMKTARYRRMEKRQNPLPTGGTGDTGGRHLQIVDC
jgi:hypothetical protein